MSTAAATPIQPPQPDVSDLLDVLYEILASGLEPDGTTASLTEIETFLHQHARAPKPREEIEGFFRASGLPMQLDTVSKDASLKLASVSTIHRASSGGDVFAPDPITGRHPVTVSSVAPRPVAPARPEPAAVAQQEVMISDSSRGLRAAVMVLCALLCVASLVGGMLVMSLRDQLSEAQASQRQLLSAVQGLQARTAELDGKLAERANVIDATHAKVERLIQSFLPAAGTETDGN